jgi:hypothetical protein
LVFQLYDTHLDQLSEIAERACSALNAAGIHYVPTDSDFPTPADTEDGILLASVLDLVRMKLTSFRLRDKVHIADMDSVGLITPEIERSLSQPMQERLRQVRAEER